MHNKQCRVSSNQNKKPSCR